MSTPEEDRLDNWLNSKPPESPVHYIHLRDRDENGRPLTRGGVTIAYINLHDVITLAVAVCSQKDNFCRRLGRNIARGRVHSGLHRWTFAMEEGATRGEVTKEVIGFVKSKVAL